MPYLFDVPPHEFPDRAHRYLLTHPENLRELVEQAAPAVAPALAFERARLLTRELPLPDWRKRENDLFFEIPFQIPQPGNPRELLVGVLLEHQTQPDSAMPLRTLVYVTGYWDDQWQAWTKRKGPKPPLVLTPVLPIVFHAGPERWTTHRNLADLFDPPPQLRPFLPQWQPVFWHLFEQPPDSLLQAKSPWMQAMAVVRHEKANLDQYQQVCGAVARRLESVASHDKIRWHNLMCFLIGWTHYRREEEELPALDTVLETSIINVGLHEEVKIMSTAAKQTLWEHAAEVTAAKTAVQISREHLRMLLEARFGNLPEDLLRRIETTEDLPRLRSCILQVLKMQSLEDLKL